MFEKHHYFDNFEATMLGRLFVLQISEDYAPAQTLFLFDTRPEMIVDLVTNAKLTNA